MTYVVESFVVFAAGLVQSLTGFGFAVIAVPFFLLFHSPIEAVVLSIFISLVTISSLAYQLRQDVNWVLFRRLFIGGVMGAPLGIPLYLYFDLNVMKLFIGCVILTFTYLGLKNVRIPLNDVRVEYLVGMLSGFLTTSVGIPGPPLLIFLSNQNAIKEVMRATSVMFFLPIYGISLLLHLFFNPVMISELKSLSSYLLGLMLVALLGQWFGRRLDIHLDQSKFQRMVYFILMFTGLYVTGNSVLSLI